MAERLSPLAGKPVPASALVDVPRLVTAFFALSPDAAVPEQRVAFECRATNPSSGNTNSDERAKGWSKSKRSTCIELSQCHFARSAVFLNQ